MKIRSKKKKYKIFDRKRFRRQKKSGVTTGPLNSTWDFFFFFLQITYQSFFISTVHDKRNIRTQ